jgi:hypothetical protein
MIGRNSSNHYKKFSKEFCTQKMKANKTMKGQAIPNHRRRKGKKVKSNIDSATHNQTLNHKQNYMTGITMYLSILTVNVNGLNSSTQKTPIDKLD